MSDCTCVYDHDARWYAAVCAFHAPGVEHPGTEQATLAGRRVAPTAVQVEVIAAPNPLDRLDLDAIRASKRAHLAEVEAETTGNLNRADRRRRGQRNIGAFGVIAGHTKRRKSR